ncbi:MAG TPA: TonB-dependent receptor [Acidobacteriota bacterium]|nr:TonB-dependent receptor [Acidobacteriota bacterium]
MCIRKSISAAIICLTFFAAVGYSQNVSATLSGTVKDPAGAVIPNAQVTLTNQATNSAEKSATNVAGIFVFPSLLPGTYSLTVSTTGFRTLTMKDITVVINERRSLGDLTLEVGEIQQTVEITAEVTPVQTASSERAGLVSGDQILNVAIKGRDFLGLLSTLPGIIDTTTSREVTATGNVLQGLHINGGRQTSIMYALDGISSVDTGSNSSVQNQPNMDAISEVSVLTSNYQAEFGRNSSGTINVVMKSGTQTFHGSAYWYYRDKGLNANSFFNNRTGTARSPYHFNNAGYSIGGPVYIPGKFNANKDKLFFFFSQEIVRRRLYLDPRFTTTPTALERAGDFSQTFDLSGKLITIKDPTTGVKFTDNKIPASRINNLGQAVLKFFPLPNYAETDPSLKYARNYRSAVSGKNPRRQEVLRIDYNITPTLRMYFRGIQDHDTEEWPYGSWVAGNVNYDLVNTLRPQLGKGAVVNITKVFNPKTVNEFTFGATTRGQTFNPVDPNKVSRSLMGNIGQWYPASAESHAIPNITFGGVQNYINPSLGNIPYTNENPVFAWTDNFNRLMGKHTLKLGVYIERMRKDEVGGPNTRGSFAFDRDTNNPLDTNYAFSNAILGIFQNYSEGTWRPYSLYRYTQVEWYAQDSWRVSKKLTLDYGIRFYNAPGAHDNRFALTTFDPSQYSASKAAVLIRPGLDANKKRVGIDPRNGTIYPQVYIGLFAPGSGTYAPGMVVGGKDGFSGALYDTPAVSIGPRFGFAWDPFGNGKTSIRAGAGVFYDRPQGNVYSGTNGQPPVAYTPTLYYGTLDTFLQSQGAVGPTSVNAPQVGQQGLPRVVNYSLGVQRDIGFGTVVDVSYVGSVGRHLLYQLNINPIPMYAHFNPANTDPTTNKPLPDNFLRPYLGLSDINERSFGATSSYNSLQVSANRRMSRGMQFGASYTFSKALGIVSDDFTNVSPYFDPRARNYGPLNFDLTHTLVVNYTYQVPSLGKKLDSKPLDAVLGGWQISGITSFISGTPVNPGFSTVDGTDITGSTEGARMNLIGNPYLPKSDRTFSRNFNTQAFARPAVRDFGNAGVFYLRNPGINNWDVTISKRVPLGLGEQRYFQFRAEFFNAFNHTQFNGMNTTARFDATGAQVNANFGALTSARDPRRIQLSLRFMF